MSRLEKQDALIDQTRRFFPADAHAHHSEHDVVFIVDMSTFQH